MNGALCWGRYAEMLPRRNNVARREEEVNIVPEGHHFGVPPPTKGTIYYIAFLFTIKSFNKYAISFQKWQCTWKHFLECWFFLQLWTCISPMYYDFDIIDSQHFSKASKMTGVSLKAIRNFLKERIGTGTLVTNISELRIRM